MTTIIFGAEGTMGRLAYRFGIEQGLDIIGVDPKSTQPHILATLDALPSADVIIDFSHISQLDNLLNYALAHQIPLVIATTGYDEQAEKKIKEASHNIPIFKSANLSMGIHVVKQILKSYAAYLDADYDIEIIEKHHRNKVDAPSGTALLLANAMQDAIPHPMNIVTDRSAHHIKRQDNEIGIQSIRSGEIVGEHTIIFASDDDVIELTHKAQNKLMFVKGAYKAAQFIIQQQPGLYGMDDLPMERK